jgi:tetratricopeptide (TPR) repeat protein
METLYDLLGALPRDDAEELRVAFRRAVKGAHPDLNPGDPDAGFKFRQIVRANQILGDEDQRATYDHLLDLADVEERQIKRRAVVHTIYQVTSGVIAFSVALAVIAGGYLAATQMPEEWAEPLAGVAATLHRSTETAAATLRQSTESAVSALRQATEAVTAIVMPSPPSAAMASTEPKQPFEQVFSWTKNEPAPAETSVPFELPPETTLPTVVTLQPEMGAPPPAKAGPPLDITLLDARAYREHGIVAYRNGDLDAAIADFDQAIQLDPKFSAAYIDRSIVFYRLRKFDRAFADIARAKRIEKSGRSTPASTPGQSTTRKRPVVELNQPSQPRRTANLDASREEGFLYRRRRD